MQIGPLSLSPSLALLPSAPPPSSGVHCATGTYRTHTKPRGNSNVNGGTCYTCTAAPSKYINNNIRGGSGIRYNYSPVRFATKIASTKITLATQREGQNRSGAPAFILGEPRALVSATRFFSTEGEKKRKRNKNKKNKN